MINPIAAAYAEKSPVIVISGGPGAGERNAGLLLHHQAKTLDSQLAMFKEITCDQAVLDDPVRAPEQIARVLGNCVAQSRPVYIEIPRDSVNAPCNEVPIIHPELNVDQDALKACVDEILKALENAKSPMLLAGVEIRRFGLEQDVAELAINLGIPVATTFMGTGLLTNTNAPLCGTYLGAAGDQQVTTMVESSDALIMLGVILSDTNFGVSVSKINTRKSILACDSSVSMSYHTYKDIPLRALVTELKGQYNIVANVKGGGLTGQTGAIQLGLARAIIDMDPELKQKLKDADLLTRDSRMVERKKYGRKKARKKFQFSKR